MKKITFLFCMAVFCMTSIALHAQTANDNRFIRTGVHSIGLNLYPIIIRIVETDNNGLQPLEIVYKRQLKDRAWRFGLSGQHTNSDISSNFNSDYGGYSQGTDISKNKNTSISAYVGHEWQLPLAKRWLFGYGADAGYQYSHTLIRSSVHTTFIDSEAETIIKTHSISATAFAEMNFAITSRLLVNIACRVNFSYGNGELRETT
ncbi:MAG: hypothetical protein LBF90_05470 [Prevotellaceae bacterium]|jgi:hypothetical protein|nr:hypothetical protein [Prevotellaceae bacterium]